MNRKSIYGEISHCYYGWPKFVEYKSLKYDRKNSLIKRFIPKKLCVMSFSIKNVRNHISQILKKYKIENPIFSKMGKYVKSKLQICQTVP